MLRQRLEAALLETGFRLQRNEYGLLVSTNRVFIHDPAALLGDPQWPEVMGIPVRDYDPEENYPFVRFKTVDELLDAPREGTTFLLFDELMLLPKEFYTRLTELCVLRRHQRVAIFAGSQRPAKIPKEVLAFTNRLLIFALSDRDDILKLKNLVTKEELARIPSLSVGQYIEVRSV